MESETLSSQNQRVPWWFPGLGLDGWEESGQRVRKFGEMNRRLGEKQDGATCPSVCLVLVSTLAPALSAPVLMLMIIISSCLFIILSPT